MKKFLLLLAGAAMVLTSQIAGAQSASALAGTWFGTFVLTKADGSVRHDNAALVIEQSTTSINGSMGRSIDQLTSWKSGSFIQGHLQFQLPVAGGLKVTLTQVDEEHLSGVALGNEIQAQIELKTAPGLLPHQQLLEEISTADQKLFEAFRDCDVAGYASYLSKNLEFYQDRTGKTDYDDNLKGLQARCAEEIHLRRELEEASLVVNAAPGFGAIEAGIQRFYSKGKDNQEHLDATARFTNVWSKESGAWKLVRVISYDHR